MTILKIRDLHISYAGQRETVQVVHGVDISVGQGERVALVGESGSGKSVTARAVLQLDTDARCSGEIVLGNTNVVGLRQKDMRSIRGDKVGLVFQDPLTALNPVMPIGWQIIQPLVIRGTPTRKAREKGIGLLERIGVRDAAKRFDDYPHQFSGGMRQRVVIAIAVINEPDLLIADEPTTALDVQVQAQVLDLLRDLADERGMSVLLITHDLGIVAGFAERVIVMRRGRVVETGHVDKIFTSPQHPYTRALLGAIPRIDSDPAARLLSVDDTDVLDHSQETPK